MNALNDPVLITGLLLGYGATFLAGAVVVSRLIGWGDDQ